MTHNATLNLPLNYPDEIDCFVLPSTILLPRSYVPISVKDPVSIALIHKAISTDRLLGVVQPQEPGQDVEKIFSMGTLGKITTFVERDEKDYFILLSGLCRFDVLQTLEQYKGYCRLKVDYHRYSFDCFEEKVSTEERKRLVHLLKGYLSYHHIQASSDEFEQVSDNDLIATLTMLCPFEPQEKQALLESPTAQNRCEMITAFLEMAVLRESGKSPMKH
jgi:hypothetical protein